MAQDTVPPPAGEADATVEYIEDEDADADYNTRLSDVDEEEQSGGVLHKHVGNAGLASSVANLSNTILGAGILAMPYALKSDGIFLGMLVIAVAGSTAAMGLYLQYRCSRYIERGGASFFAVAQKTYPQIAVAFDAAIAVKCFGVGVSYLIIIGDLMPQVVGDFVYGGVDVPASVVDSRRVWITICMVLLVPLCFLRRLDSLKYTSVVALFSIAYLTVLVVGHFLGDSGTGVDRGGEALRLGPQSLAGVLSTLSIVVFGFTCHQNMFSIVNELKDGGRQESVLAVIGTSIGSAVVLYAIVGVAGYATYGDAVGGNIISMYGSSFSAAVGRAAIVVLVLFSYPLQCHPCRASLDHIYTHFVGGARNARASLHAIPTRRFVVLTAAIMVLSFAVAMAVTSLEKVLAFVGATGSTSISFILPGLFGYKLLGSATAVPVLGEDGLAVRAGEGEGEALLGAPEGAPRHVPRRGPDGEGGLIKYASVALAAWGVFIMVVCLGTNIALL
ncbi:transmembrane amino acid transporter protein-domain-containing protein [Limtongia smithiae]|uniref:transmembrane amino acid transporter protein-domain-containing protein n=1 Tax=Limtongia smithiae TaxID=1125753 RepID=UPI0034CD388C